MTPHPQSHRVRSERASGGKPGHAGHSLALVAAPDEVQVHAPARCQSCGHSCAGVPALRWERRQVVDLPPIRARVTEHRVASVCCPGPRHHAQRGVSAGGGGARAVWPRVATLAVSLTQELVLPLARTSTVLAEVFGCPVAQGTLERVVANCCER